MEQNNMKLYVFDLDNTLAPVGKPAPPGLVRALLTLERAGAAVALCSGKPTYYLCAIARQFGLASPILIGENGAAIQLGVELPPEKEYAIGIPEVAKAAMKRIRRYIDSRYGDEVWYQPNEHVLTCFPRKPELFAPINAYLSREWIKNAGLKFYAQPDCFDIVPESIDKGAGIRLLCGKLGFSLRETTVFGDSCNDLPMFRAAGRAVAVSGFSPPEAHMRFANAGDAVQWVLLHDFGIAEKQ